MLVCAFRSHTYEVSMDVLVQDWEKDRTEMMAITFNATNMWGLGHNRGTWGQWLAEFFFSVSGV